jgi:hypothetical protein
MAAARLHQSKYRHSILNVPCDEYGNRLQEKDAVALLNYYPKLRVREVLRQRYSSYSKIRDANMLRSEHMSFNFFAPFVGENEFSKPIYEKSFGLSISQVLCTKIEFAPEPKTDYLGDGTSFDVYVEYLDDSGRKCGIGIEVKYTELAYKIGKREKETVEDKSSRYWQTASNSRIFVNGDLSILGSDVLRQIWRNHLLGLSMVARKDIEEFKSITIHPSGNVHFIDAIREYKTHLKTEFQSTVSHCFFEDFISNIEGDSDILHWKNYLAQRYLVDHNGNGDSL